MILPTKKYKGNSQGMRHRKQSLFILLRESEQRKDTFRRSSSLSCQDCDYPGGPVGNRSSWRWCSVGWQKKATCWKASPSFLDTTGKGVAHWQGSNAGRKVLEPGREAPSSCSLPPVPLQTRLDSVPLAKEIFIWFSSKISKQGTDGYNWGLEIVTW